MKKPTPEGQLPADIPPRMLTLSDVLESEFVNLRSDRNIGEDNPEYSRILDEADDPFTGDGSYLELRQRHQHALKQLESFLEKNGQAPRDDPARKVWQEPCDEAERERLCRMIAILRTQRRSALCFSGGGIRSATFGLGVLQGMSHHRLLTEFDYLSTVSGGGYIGSWLSAWRKRGDSIDDIEKSLRAKPTGKLDGERPEIEHLRSYSNYLTPRLGFFSADTWTLIATVIRNMFLNWMILVPMLAVALLIPKLALEMVHAVPNFNWVTNGIPAVPAELVGWGKDWPFLTFHPPTAWSWPWVLVMLLAAGSILAVIGVFFIARYLPSVGGKNCSQKGYLWTALIPLSVSAILLSTFWNGWIRPGGTLPWYAFVVFGAVLHFCGWLKYAIARVDAGVLLGATVTGGFGGWIAWVLTHTFRASDPGLVTCFGFPLVLGVYFFVTVLLIGLTSKITNDDDREWWARSGGWILIVSVVWLIASVLVVYGPDWVHSFGSWIFGAGGLAGIGGSLVGRSSKTGPAQTASKSDSKGESKTESAKSGGNSDSFSLFSMKTWLSVVATIAPLVFLVALLLAISKSADLLVKDQAVDWMKMLPAILRPSWLNPNPLAVVAIVAIALAIAWAMAKFVNVNTFSLHAMYRARLIRAYLGAARTTERVPSPEGTLNLFTGFDPKDNFPIAHLPPGRPFHILNICLNLVHGDRLAWQERKAETFTVSRLHSGSARLGYQSSCTYGNKPGKHDSEAERYQNEGITLGTAMAISGAAASPNMGYHSSPLLTFMMTFFNARLGWWLANPGYPGEGLWGERGPKSALKSLFAEALGNTDDQNPYVYLSDGGHFENLGLYEMVLRRCDTIVVIDAGADPNYQFEDLANAVRKIRVDLGVTIHFDKPLDMHPGEVAGNVHCATAQICYDCTDGDVRRGTLIYIKPVLDPMLSVDLDQYHSTHPDFPQQPTADQWFDESQFESYRRLGLETIDSICENKFSRTTMTLKDFVAEASAHKIATKRARSQC